MPATVGALFHEMLLWLVSEGWDKYPGHSCWRTCSVGHSDNSGADS